MNYPLTLISIILIVSFIYFSISTIISIKKKKNLEKFISIGLNNNQKAILSKTPYYPKLSYEDKQKIEKSIIIFTYTKNFIGVGLEITEEMKIIISFYACLLLLHKNFGCYNNLETIIIYPSAMILKSVANNGGIYTKEQFLIDGQSANDSVILAWHDAKKEAYHLRHNNVIIHEFTHEIDFMSGEINGVPPIEKSKYDEWIRIMFNDYKKLSNVVIKNRDWGKYKILGDYASTNEMEFFAVVSERFFESPHALKKHFPELYNELKEFFRFDPINILGI